MTIPARRYLTRETMLSDGYDFFNIIFWLVVSNIFFSPYIGNKHPN